MSACRADPDSVLALLERAVAEAGERPAVVTAEDTLTWAQLDAAARRLAGALARAGVRAGERVALWLPNGTDWAVAHWAAVRNGNVVVPLSTRLPAEQVLQRLEHADVRALFASAGFEGVDLGPPLRRVLERAPAGLSLTVVRGGSASLGESTLEWERFAGTAEASTVDFELDPDVDPGVDPDGVHLIQYTSGTTGEPKGAMLRHRGLVQAACAHAAAWGLAAGDAVFVPNPLSHILGFVYGCLVPAAAGAACATQAVFDPRAALELIARSGAVAMTGAPTHLSMLAEHPERARFDLSRLRLAMTGGAAITPEQVRRVTRDLGLEAVLNGYGMSEAGSVSQTRSDDSPEVLAASIGHVMPWLESRVVDPSNGEDVRARAAGELWIRGAAVMQGYLDDQGRVGAGLTPDGWLRTGDLVRQDAAGRLVFAGRLTDRFTVGGFNVHPLAVERVLERHPAVAEAAVLGLPDERLGAVPVALLRTRGEAPAAEELAAFCGEALASYEVPRRFDLVDELPHNPAGKLDRRRLAERVTVEAQDVPDEPEEPDFGNYFVATYPPFSQWSEAAVGDYLAVLEQAPAEDVPLGIYVHVPFCVERCSYCYYLSHSGQQLKRVDEYLAALVAESRSYAARPAIAGRSPEFVYFGGGTPSLLSAEQLRRLFGALTEALPWPEAREVTFECAPRSVDREKLAVLRAAGVTRLSLGVQQLDDDVLRRNGRVHLVADVEAALAAVREVGFDVVNLDLIVGLVGESEASLAAGLERVLALAPDSVTVYQLEIPYNTPLCRELRHGEIEAPPPSWPEKHARTRAVFARLFAAGYHPISAYAAVRDPERHPFVYQDAQYHGADLLGLGVASFGYLQGVHHQNAVELDAYLGALAAGRLPRGRAWALDAEERAVRELVLQLKLGRVDRVAWERKHGLDLGERLGEPLKRFAALGWLRTDATSVELTPEGVPRVDRMLPAFYQPRHRVARYA